MKNQLFLMGQYRVQLWRPSGLALPDKRFRDRKARSLISDFKIKNGIVDVGVEAMFNTFFGDDTGAYPTSFPWYIGLVDNGTWSGFPNSDTMSSHGDWTEFTNYDESARQAFMPAAADNRNIISDTPAEFTFAGSGSLKGIFLSSDNGDPTPTDGILWSTASFVTPLPVQDDDVLKIFYSLTG